MSEFDKWHYIGEGSQEIDDIVSGIGSPNSEDREEFRKSKLYAQLTPSQLIKSESAYGPNNRWSVLAPADSDEAALWIEEYKHVPFMGPVDTVHDVSGLILSGAYGEFVERELNKKEREAIYEILDIPKDFDVQKRLMLVGGVTHAIANSGGGDNSYVSTADVCDEGVITEGGTRTEFLVGADMAGDFRTTQRTSATISYVTPQGDRVPFGPVRETLVPFYYGVEIGVIRSILTHLVVQQGYDLKRLGGEIFGLISMTTRNPSENIMSGRDLYANFGDSSDTTTLRVEHSVLRSALSTYKAGEEMELLANSPFLQYGDRKTISSVISSPRGLLLKSVSNAGEIEFSIPNKVLPMYIAALCSQDFGRTDSASMKFFLSLVDMGEEEIQRLLLRSSQ